MLRLLRRSTGKFVCIRCSRINSYTDDDVSKEAMQCIECGATWRDRAVLLNFLKLAGLPSEYLFGSDVDMSIIGLGIGDSYRVQTALGGKFSYTNTFIDRFPYLDLQNISTKSTFQIIICSEILEHVMDLDLALKGVRKIMKADSKLILTVPMDSSSSTIEHYPGIVKYRIKHNKVYWQDRRGKNFISPNPIFHGGEGQTLEMRKLSEVDFESKLLSHGFAFYKEGHLAPEFGVPKLRQTSGIYIVSKLP